MASLTEKIKLLSSNRPMQAAYARWLLAKLSSGKPPVLEMGDGVRIGGWIKFSEYWWFQNAVPEAERRFVKRSLGSKPDRSVAFDIGANIGVFTCLLAATGAGQVHSFEPIPETFCRLKHNVQTNHLLARSVLNCLAVGRHPELITFAVQADSPAENRLAPAGADASPGMSLQHVAATSLDVYCETYGVMAIDFLKVDVEGMEVQVLQGAERMFAERRIEAVLLEVCPENLRAAGSSVAALDQQIARLGYRAHHLDPSGHPDGVVHLEVVNPSSFENVVLLPA